MKKTSILFLSIFFTGSFCFSSSLADGDSLPYKAKMYAGIQAGSTGFGLQFSYPINNMIAIRAVGSVLPAYNMVVKGKDGTVDITSDYNFKTGGIGIIGDFSFIKNKPGIKVAAGAIYNMTSVSGRNTYYETTYKMDLGYLDIAFKPSLPVNPYLGLALSNIKNSKLVFITLEAGAMYMGKPKVTFTGDGRISPTANEDNTAIITKNVQSVQFYPYANLQINFKIGK